MIVFFRLFRSKKACFLQKKRAFQEEKKEASQEKRKRLGQITLFQEGQKPRTQREN